MPDKAFFALRTGMGHSSPGGRGDDLRGLAGASALIRGAPPPRLRPGERGVEVGGVGAARHRHVGLAAALAAHLRGDVVDEVARLHLGGGSPGDAGSELHAPVRDGGEDDEGGAQLSLHLVHVSRRAFASAPSMQAVRSLTPFTSLRAVDERIAQLRSHLALHLFERLFDGLQGRDHVVDLDGELRDWRS